MHLYHPWESYRCAKYPSRWDSPNDPAESRSAIRDAIKPLVTPGLAGLISLATRQDFADSPRDIRTYFRKARYLDDTGTASLLWPTRGPRGQNETGGRWSWLSSTVVRRRSTATSTTTHAGNPGTAACVAGVCGG